MSSQFRVMTSGGFTAAYRELIPQLQTLTGLEIVTVTTSIGTGETSIPNRLKRGEIADLVICAETVFQSFLADQLARAEHHAPLARSIIGFAVRAGAAKPDIATPDKLRDTLLRATSIGYSASESGKYVTTQLYQRLGIADEALKKSVFVGNGERVGTLIARGEVEVGFQQVSELLPIEGIAHITPIPEELQLVTTFRAGIGATAVHPEAAARAVAFLCSPDAVSAIRVTGLESLAH